MPRSKKKIRKYSSAKKRAETHKSGWEPTVYKVDEGVNVFTIKEGIRKIDIIPYEVGKGNPEAEEGELHYERTFWHHRDIGADRNKYVCLAKTAGKPCPVCEVVRKMMQDPDADEKLMRELMPRERQFFNVIDREDLDRGVQVWEFSYHLFGKLLDKEITNSDEEDGFEDFFHVEGGMTLKLGVGEKSIGGGRPFCEVETIGFRKRKEDYDDDVIDKAHKLDDLLILLDYDKLRSIFLQTEDADKDDDESEGKHESKSKATGEKEKSKKREKTEDVDQGDGFEVSVGDEVLYNGGPCEVLRVGGDGTKLMVEDEDRKSHKITVDDLDKKEEKKSEKAEDEEDDWDKEDDWD